jgi:hypothetical protein
MRYKILNFDEYANYFQFDQTDTGFGIENDPITGEQYLAMQTFLPKNSIYKESSVLNPFMNFQSKMTDIPEQILVKFELFAIGNVENLDAFVFKPWVLNVNNKLVCDNMEKFHLFVPSYLFYHLVDRFIFLEQFTWNQIKNIRVIKDIKSSKAVNLINDKSEIDFSPFIKVREMNLFNVDNIFQNTFDSDNANLDIEQTYINRFKEYFE